MGKTIVDNLYFIMVNGLFLSYSLFWKLTDEPRKAEWFSSKEHAEALIQQLLRSSTLNMKKATVVKGKISIGEEE